MKYVLLRLKGNNVTFYKTVSEESITDVISKLNIIDHGSEYVDLLHWMSIEHNYSTTIEGGYLIFNSELLRYRLDTFHNSIFQKKAYLVIVCTENSDTALIGTYFVNQPHSAARIVLTDYPTGWENCPFEDSVTVSLSRASKIPKGWFEWLKDIQDHIFIKSIEGEGGILVIELNKFINYLTNLEERC